MDPEGSFSMNMTRRRFLLAVAGTAGVALLAACAEDDPEAGAEDEADDAAADDEGEEEEPSEGDDDQDDEPTAGADDDASDEESDDGEPRSGGTLRYGIVNDPPTMDPHQFSGAASDVLYGMVYSRLVRYGETWEIEGELAESWEADDTSYTFQLHEGVQFHDGSEMTADDVRYSFERIMDEATGAYVRSLIAGSFDNVEVVDDLTVQVTLSEVNAAFLAALALPTAAVVSEEFVESGEDLSSTMMGTGPFRFVSREPNVEVQLEKHSEYFEEGRPYLDAITLVPLPDETARSSGLRTGSVDFIDFVPWKDMESIESEGFDIHSDMQSSGLWMFMKVTVEGLDDVRVRQAINFAVNRDAVVQSSFFGRGASMEGIFVPTSSWAYIPDLPGAYTYDPERARELLTEAGAEGLALQFVSTSEVEMHLSGAEVIHQNLRELGIEVELETQDWSSTVERQNAGDYEMIMWGGGPLYGDPDYLSGYFETGNFVPQNTGYSNPDLDELLQSARSTLDRDERLEFYRQAYEIILEEAPWVPLCYREQGEASASYVRGYNRVLGSNWNGYRAAMTWLAEE